MRALFSRLITGIYRRKLRESVSVDSVNNSNNSVQRNYQGAEANSTSAARSAQSAEQSPASGPETSASSSSDGVNMSAKAESAHRSRVASLDDDEPENAGATEDQEGVEEGESKTGFFSSLFGKLGLRTGETGNNAESSEQEYYEDGVKGSANGASGADNSAAEAGAKAGTAHSKEADDLARYIAGEYEQQGWKNFNPEDVIRVCATDGDDVIHISSRSLGTLDIEINGETVTYKNGDLKKLLIDAGAGDDVITIEPQYIPDLYMKGIHVAGGEGNDKITGGSGNDVIFDYYGAADIDGGDGDDVIITRGLSKDGSQTYDSILRGGKGDDYIEGGLGNDKMDGGEGHDVLYGMSGDDQLLGGKGSDYLDGGRGNDILKGGTGRDTLVGGKGDDELLGGAGDDLLIGASDADTMDGEEGADRIIKDGKTDVVAKDSEDSVQTLAVAKLPKNYTINGDDFERERLESDVEFLASTENGQLMFSKVGKTKHKVELNTTFGRSLNRTNSNSEKRNVGADSKVYINRSKVSLEQGYDWDHCPPVVGLFHEMVHSYNAAIGNMDHKYYNSKGKQVSEKQGTRGVEYQAVGISNPAVKANDPRLTENGMREFLGLKDRLKY